MMMYRQITETGRLQFALKCFQSSNLEKRRGGLSDIREFLTNVLKRDEWNRKVASQTPSPASTGSTGTGSNVQLQPTEAERFPPNLWVTSTYAANPPVVVGWLTTKQCSPPPSSLACVAVLSVCRYMVDWLRQSQIMEQLYQRNIQIEILRRCNEIPRFLARYNALTAADIDMMWTCAEVRPPPSAVVNANRSIGDSPLALWLVVGLLPKNRCRARMRAFGI